MDKLKDLISRSGITLDHSKIHFITGNDGKTQTVQPLDAFLEGKFKEWQELQNQRKFPLDEKIVSLIRLKDKDKWLFAGVYAVQGVKALTKGEPEIPWHPEGVPRDCFKYSTRELSGLEHLTGCAIVQYLKNFRNACVKGENHYDNMVVYEILDQKMSAKVEFKAKDKSLSIINEPATSQIYLPPKRGRSPYFGEPMDFRGLRHAPINENGVIFLFGMVSYELGFIVEAIHNAYPDCEAKRCIDRRRNRWQRIRIEFEHKTSHFKDHGHDPQNCDVIVCWEHDWADCPIEIEVIELKKVINELPKEARYA